ncbi:hypothetical protein E2F46_09760 [Luteimonas aestuarii]|uniref:DUF2306 domain-containing protein n=1 Tax=Luteimonas aestuarii TaxID=453837 RepID=A0A4R5TQN0_9GAMM|nr:hypothetical protein [Luteimonas aestuarii]TDK23807.1 hypothetical protein E2F46_09760 [Luteimonas aestuarii]
MSSVATSHAMPRTRRRGLFFPAMGLLLLASVVLGFWGTLFRPSQPLPLHQQVHGIVVTAWFVLFAVQALLVAGGRTALHRRLGTFGVVLAVAVIVTSLHTMAQMPTQWRLGGIDVDARRGMVSMVLWGNFGALVAYATLLSRAIAMRTQADAHKRLMLLAMFAIMSPALVRVFSLPVFAGLPAVPLTMAGLLALGAILVAYDLLTLRRVHRQTLWGVPFFLVVHLAPAYVLPGTAIDAAMLRMIW